MLRRLNVFFLCLCVLVLPGCQLLTPEQREAARQSIQADYDAGLITAAQRDMAVEALAKEGSVDWAAILTAGGSVVASILLGVPIAVGRVNKARGPINARKGLPPTGAVLA